MYRNYMLAYTTVSTLCLISTMFLYQTDMNPTPPVQKTSVAILVFMVIYFLVEFVRCASPASCHIRRPIDAYRYTAEQEIGMPRFTAPLVWCLVYGLGAFTFISFFIFSAQIPYTTHFFTVGLFVLCIEDFVNPPDAEERRAIPSFIAATISTTGIFMLLAINPDFTLLAENITPELCLTHIIMPSVTPILVALVRSLQAPIIKFTHAWDLFEFSLPFSFVIAGVVCTTRNSFLVDIPDYVTCILLVFTPLLSIAAIVILYSNAIHGGTVDSLISLAFAATIRDIAFCPFSSYRVAILLFPLASFLLRACLGTTPGWKVSASMSRETLIADDTIVPVDD